MTRLVRFTIPLLVLVIACAPVHGEEARTPANLIRALRASQDRITLGDTDAHLSQRTSLTQIAEQLAAASAEAWKEPRNARAALAFVLSGGAPAILKKLIELGALPGIEDKLARGVLAYGEGRDADALDLLSAIDARELNASIAGHIALAQAELIAKKEPKKALEFLDDARLLTPGTLIEEAALRRQVSVVAAAGDFDRFEMLSTNYLRRFSRSVYAGAFRRQFAADVASRADTSSGDRTARLQAALDGLEPAERRDVYLTIAREALIRGKAPLARFGASNAFPLFEEGSAEKLQAGLYEAAALVVADDVDKGAATLEAMDKAKLGEEDAELAAAAAAIATEVRRMPSIADVTAPPGADDLAATLKVVGRARDTMARIDELLSGARE